MKKIWRTIKAGALAAMLACTAPGYAKADPPKRPTVEHKGCSRLETIAKREAAGIPQDLAKASHDLSKKLKPRVQYQCTVVKKTSGRFNAERTYDVYSLGNPRGKGLKPSSKDDNFVWALNIVSDDNLSRGYPPLVNDSINYVTQFNLLYSEKNHHLKTNFAKTFDPKKIIIYRFTKLKHKVPKSLQGYEIYKLYSVGYKFTKLPRGVKRKTDDSGAQLLPLYPELVIPYKALKPDFVKLTPKPPKPQSRAAIKPRVVKPRKLTIEEWNKRGLENKLKSRKKKKPPLPMTYGIGFGLLTHKAFDEPYFIMTFDAGYNFKKWTLGAYFGLNFGGGTAREHIEDEYGNVYHSDYASFGGTVGAKTTFLMHKYLRGTLSLGMVLEPIKEVEDDSSITSNYGNPAPDLKTYDFGIALGVDMGAGLCANIPLKGGSLAFCLEYRMHYVKATDKFKDRYEGNWKDTPSHGGLVSVSIMIDKSKP